MQPYCMCNLIVLTIKMENEIRPFGKIMDDRADS